MKKCIVGLGYVGLPLAIVRRHTYHLAKFGKQRYLTRAKRCLASSPLNQT
jgi:hypothetical protein